MKRVYGFAIVACALAIVAGPPGSLALSGGSGGGGTGGSQPSRGSVALKPVTTSTHGGSSSGSGQVIPVGGYYIAPAVICTANFSGLDLPDGTQVYVTLEYLSAGMDPVVVATTAVAGGKGSIDTTSNPTSVSASAGFNTMSVRLMDGTVLLSGSVKGL